ncbi:hypothetical protein ACI2IP_06865 [Microbacterium sp. NPDC090218]
MSALSFGPVDLTDGARTISLRGTEEWLHQPTGTRTRTDFAATSLGGWDEMLPTIDACRVPQGDGFEDWGDHGEVWNRRWSGGSTSHEVAVRGLRLRRTVTQESAGVRLDYALTSEQERPVQWAAHPQFVWTPGTTLELGRAAPWRRVYPDAGERTLAAEVDPSSLLDSPAGAKWWSTEPIDHVVLRRPDGTGLRLSWDADVLPWVALWVDPGAFASAPVIAIEPALVPHDSLADAVRVGSAPTVGPERSLAWWLRLAEID